MCDAQQYDVQDVAVATIPSIIRVARSIEYTPLLREEDDT